MLKPQVLGPLPSLTERTLAEALVSLAELHGIITRIASEPQYCDALTSDEHVAWMRAGELLGRVRV